MPWLGGGNQLIGHVEHVLAAVEGQRLVDRFECSFTPEARAIFGTLSSS